MAVPKPCRKCAPFEGLWQQLPNGSFDRCDCKVGEQLLAADHKRNEPPNSFVTPVITQHQASHAVEGLSTIPYFPMTEGAWTMIGDSLMRFVSDPSHLGWLVRRMNELYGSWPGVLEMRRVYTSRFQPLDGIDPPGISEVYPDHIPSERPQVQERPKQIAGGAEARDRIAESLKQIGPAKRPPEAHGKQVADRSRFEERHG